MEQLYPRATCHHVYDVDITCSSKPELSQSITSPLAVT